jgi:hypothetical protein
MKTIIEYSDSVDDQMALKRVMKATDMAIVIFEIQRNVRKRMTTPNTPEEYVEGVEDTLNFINELIEEHGIIINDLIN